MLSYAGVILDLPLPGDVPGLFEFLSPTGFTEFLVRTWPGPEMEALGFSAAIPSKPFSLGSLYWPVGAARFAVAHYLVTTPVLDAIRATCYQPSNAPGLVPMPLVIADGQSTVTANLFMLPPRPLALVTPSTPGLFLLTLCDQRFYWWFRTGQIIVTGGTTEWASDVTIGGTTYPSVYSQISSALGVTITVDTIGSEYLLPGLALNDNYRALPVLLDSVAASVGHKIVCDLSGNVRSMNAGTSQTIYQSNLLL